MFTIKPDFYDSFKCIADKCTDSCCIGWEIDVDKNAIQRIESGERFVTDIELKVLAQIFELSVDELLS